jgi:GNAT superfamily N-acetyltransferase
MPSSLTFLLQPNFYVRWTSSTHDGEEPKNNTVVIRRAVFDDVDTLVKLYHDAYQENVQLGFPASAANVEAEEVNTWIEDAYLFVAYIQDELLGAVRIMYDRNWDRLVLSRLGVPTSWKGKGIATQLMFYAEEYAKTLGFSVLRLTTAENHPYLPAIYRRKGYQDVGRRELTDRPYDEVILEKRLD